MVHLAVAKLQLLVSPPVLVTKVLVNQMCFTPIFNTYFFGMQAILAGEDIGAVWERIKRTVPISFVNSCKLWPAVTAFSFTFVPLEYRSLFAGFIAVGWYVDSFIPSAPLWSFMAAKWRLKRNR